MNSMSSLVWDGKFPLFLTMRADQEDLDLLAKYEDAVASLRDHMKEVYADELEWEEINFKDYNLGFLVAKGVPYKDTHLLVAFIRYTLQDFDKDPEINPPKEKK